MYSSAIRCCHVLAAWLAPSRLSWVHTPHPAPSSARDADDALLLRDFRTPAHPTGGGNKTPHMHTSCTPRLEFTGESEGDDDEGVYGVFGMLTPRRDRRGTTVYANAQLDTSYTSHHLANNPPPDPNRSPPTPADSTSSSPPPHPPSPSNTHAGNPSTPLP